MKVNIKEFIKANQWIYSAYYYVFSLFIRFIRLFVKTDDKLILFVSFGGRYFNDSPKYIYNAMLKDERFKDFRLVWAFTNPDSVDLPTPKVKISSINYFITALKARCWVTNVVVERGLNFMGKNTFYFHTTHTTLMKLMGNDAVRDYRFKGFKVKAPYRYNCSLAQSEKEADMQLSMFDITRDKVEVFGYPKNDSLCNYSENEVSKIKKKLGLEACKKIILYCPTFREDTPGAMSCPVDFNKWKSILGDDYIVLFRAHPVVANNTDVSEYKGFVLDVSSYPDNVDLMKVADILISDYSGIFFEFGVQDKPMYCFPYDYDEYTSMRGLYFDVREVIPGGNLSEEELLKSIMCGGFPEDKDKLKKLREDYIAVYGHATELSINKIYNEITQ